MMLQLDVTKGRHQDDREVHHQDTSERAIRPVLKGCYVSDLADAARLPDKEWIIRGGEYSEGDDPPDYTPDRKEEENSPCVLSTC